MNAAAWLTVRARQRWGLESLDPLWGKVLVLTDQPSLIGPFSVGPSP
jgi:hypothetical protein